MRNSYFAAKNKSRKTSEIQNVFGGPSCLASRVFLDLKYLKGATKARGQQEDKRRVGLQ